MEYLLRAFDLPASNCPPVLLSLLPLVLPPGAFIRKFPAQRGGIPESLEFVPVTQDRGPGEGTERMPVWFRQRDLEEAHNWGRG
jgi:hypothetical protein